MTVTLIADDLTGACDAGALFAGRGTVGVFLDAAAIGDEWEVAALDTESRGLPSAEARERTRAAARALRHRVGAGTLFKKIDSTLRGAVGHELESLLDETDRATAVVCPALPREGRTVRDGLLRVHAVPAHESPVGRDPAYPGATSDVRDILVRQAGRPVAHVPIDSVRRGHAAVAKALAEAAGHIVAADAETDGDLDVLAAAALATPAVLVAGSAGLARAVSAHLGHAGPPVERPAGRAWLIVIGSLHPASRAQLGALREAGIPGAVLDGAEASGAGGADIERIAHELDHGRPAYLTTSEATSAPPHERAAMARALGAAAAAICRRARPDVLALVGGDTAHAVMRALGARHLALRGADAAGLGVGELCAGDGARITCLTKAGGFGAPDCLLAPLRGPR